MYYHSSHVYLFPYNSRSQKEEALSYRLSKTDEVSQREKVCTLQPLIPLSLLMKYYLSRFVLHVLIIDKYDFQDVAAELKKLEIMKEDLEAELKRVTSIRTYPRATY